MRGIRVLKYPPRLIKPDITLYAYGKNNHLPIIGRFDTQVDYASRRHVEFNVVDGNGGNLISYATSVDLGIINPIKPNKSHKIINRKEAQGYAGFSTSFLRSFRAS
jgi:hypothetical protein